MPKELPETNTPPGVFQMFNERRTFYFESDISSLPNPPTNLPGPVSRVVLPRLKKSRSQPQLHYTAFDAAHASHSSIALSVPPSQASSTSTSTAAGAAAGGGNLHLPAAIMASTAYQAPSGLHSGDGQGHLENLGSLQSRYHTEPSYSSSNILRSFKHEFNFFGHKRGRNGSQSAPTSPRRASSPEIIVPADVVEASGYHHQHHHTDQGATDIRKLSLVKEESDGDLKMDTGDGGVVTGQLISQQAVQSIGPAKKSELLKSAVSPNKDFVDGQMPRASQPSLTKQMMKWFVTPQNTAVSSSTSAKRSRSEFNAMSPSSF